MIYVDVDGVVADFDSWLISVNHRALEDTHLLFKTIYQFYERAFAESQLLVEPENVLHLGKIIFLSALPNFANIQSFTDKNHALQIMSILENNKRNWIERYFGSVQLIIVSSSSEKLKYCGVGNVLIDDNQKLGKKWKSRGGIYYQSIEEFKGVDTFKQGRLF